MATRYNLRTRFWEVGCADYKMLNAGPEHFMLRDVDEALYAALI